MNAPAVGAGSLANASGATTAAKNSVPPNAAAVASTANSLIMWRCSPRLQPRDDLVAEAPHVGQRLVQGRAAEAEIGVRHAELGERLEGCDDGGRAAGEDAALAVARLRLVDRAVPLA